MYVETYRNGLAGSGIEPLRATASFSTVGVRTTSTGFLLWAL